MIKVVWNGKNIVKKIVLTYKLHEQNDMLTCRSSLHVPLQKGGVWTTPQVDQLVLLPVGMGHVNHLRLRWDIGG